MTVNGSPFDFSGCSACPNLSRCLGRFETEATYTDLTVAFAEEDALFSDPSETAYGKATDIEANSQGFSELLAKQAVDNCAFTEPEIRNELDKMIDVLEGMRKQL